jgi:hypothetical protein
MYYWDILTSKEKTLFFEGVSKFNIVRFSKNYPNIKLLNTSLYTKIYFIVRKWHKNY